MSPKPQLKPKPLDKDADRQKIKQQVEKRLIATKEAVVTETLTKLALQKRVGNGVGNQAEFYDELINGFKKTLSARGIEMPSELRDKIKDNKGRIAEKDQGPSVVLLSKKYGVVSEQN